MAQLNSTTVRKPSYSDLQGEINKVKRANKELEAAHNRIKQEAIANKVSLDNKDVFIDKLKRQVHVSTINLILVTIAAICAAGVAIINYTGVINV